MKTRLSNYCFYVSVLALATFAPLAHSQTPTGLSLQTYAGITITGAVGGVLTVQYATDPTQADDWRAATIVQLSTSPFLWVDTSGPASAKRFYRTLQGPTNLTWIPSGTFTLGSPSTEVDRIDWEGPLTVVELSRGFFLGKWEVTQAEYLAVIGSNPSFFTNDLNRPVEGISWMDATNYCARLTEQERQARRLPAGWVYRLPTNAEWEYACRAGATTRFYYGDDIGYTSLTNYAWYGENSAQSTHAVGTRPANPWGLYDMAGNVSEWVQDWIGLNYPGGRLVDPQGPATGVTRVLRGGSWADFGARCRSASRSDGEPGFKGVDTGLRVVLATGP
jgi:formylglycine-generating enzyme required for sulfatase activity